MSRLGKKPINLPAGVTLELTANEYVVSGAKGRLSHPYIKGVDVRLSDGQIVTSVQNPDQSEARTNWGLAVSLLKNMVIGVSQGFTKQLEINGIGFKAELKGKELVLNVGFSHPVSFPVPDGVEIKVEKNIITVSGMDKQLIGQTAANIRGIRPPEPYKGKGIKYVDEHIRRKVGKQVKTTA